jgi:hypothetical protein
MLHEGSQRCGIDAQRFAIARKDAVGQARVHGGPEMTADAPSL